MTVNELADSCSFKPLVLSEPDREIEGVYIGDLLSWVMGRAQYGNAWLTIMNNMNVAAVASLADVSCVILCEGVSLDDNIRATAESKGLNILSADLPAYEAAVKISAVL